MSIYSKSPQDIISEAQAEVSQRTDHKDLVERAMAEYLTSLSLGDNESVPVSMDDDMSAVEIWNMAERETIELAGINGEKAVFSVCADGGWYEIYCEDIAGVVRQYLP